jgi:hypothetical protein
LANYSDPTKEASKMLRKSVSALICSIFVTCAALQADSPSPPDTQPTAPVLPNGIFLQGRSNHYLDDASTAELKRELDQLGKDQADEQRLDEDLAKATDASGRIVPTHEALVRAGQELDDQFQTLNLDAESDRARIEALTNAISSLVTAEQQIDNNTKLTVLQREVEDRQKDLDNVSIVAGNVAGTNAKIAELTIANGRLTAERQLLMSAAGVDSLGPLRKELTDVTIAQQARSARLAELQKQRATLKNVIDLMDQIQSLQADEANLNSSIQTLQS